MGMTTKQNRDKHTECKLYLDSERRALRMGINVRSGGGLCLLLMITKGTWQDLPTMLFASLKKNPGGQGQECRCPITMPTPVP